MGRLYGALLGLSMIWGTSFLFIKLLVEELGSEFWALYIWCLHSFYRYVFQKRIHIMAEHSDLVCGSRWII